MPKRSIDDTRARQAIANLLATAESSSQRTPRAFGYARVSHSNSFKRDNSLPGQRERIEGYFEQKLQPKGIQLAGIYDDGTNVSAYRTQFWCRPAGKRIMAEIKPGDHLILDKVDRIWRSISDFTFLMERLDQLQITVHIVNFLGESIQNNSPMGKFVIKQFVLIAELESEIKSERIREGLQRQRMAGNHASRFCPCGARMVRYDDATKVSGRAHRLEWCKRTRAWMKHLKSLIEDPDDTFMQACEKFEHFLAKQQKRKVRELHEWEYVARKTWRKWWHYECAYLYLGVTEPSLVPPVPIVDEAWRQYQREWSARTGRGNAFTNHSIATPMELWKAAFQATGNPRFRAILDAGAKEAERRN